MPAAEHTFTVDKGATFQRTLVWRSAPDTPINLAGYTARLAIDVRTRSGDWSNALTVLSSGPGIVITPSAGRLVVRVTSTQTQALHAASKYRYSLFVTAPNTDVTRLLHGDFTVIE